MNGLQLRVAIFQLAINLGDSCTFKIFYSRPIHSWGTSRLFQFLLETSLSITLIVVVNFLKFLEENKLETCEGNYFKLRDLFPLEENLTLVNLRISRTIPIENFGFNYSKSKISFRILEIDSLKNYKWNFFKSRTFSLWNNTPWSLIFTELEASLSRTLIVIVNFLKFLEENKLETCEGNYFKLRDLFPLEENLTLVNLQMSRTIPVENFGFNYSKSMISFRILKIDSLKNYKWNFFKSRTFSLWNNTPWSLILTELEASLSRTLIVIVNFLKFFAKTNRKHKKAIFLTFGTFSLLNRTTPSLISWHLEQFQSNIFSVITQNRRYPSEFWEFTVLKSLNMIFPNPNSLKKHSTLIFIPAEASFFYIFYYNW